MNACSSDLSLQVAEYCAAIGHDPLLVQGAGGNVSWKKDDVLHVKASGTWLADAMDREIFVQVDLAELRLALDAGNFNVKPRPLGKTTLRPSIETLLHALLPQRVVMHLHAIELLAHLVRVDAEAILQERVGNRLPWVIVDYEKPGAELARAVHGALQRRPDTQVIFLRNHGVVIGADNVDQASAAIELLCELLATQPAAHAAASTHLPRDLSDEYRHIDDAQVHELALHEELFHRLETEWALYPDHVVFLGARPELYASEAAFFEARAAGALPELVFIAGRGVFARHTFNEAKTAQLRCYYDVLARQPDSDRTVCLGPAQVADLLNWDAERYRMSVAK
ncbi:class II aldolase/adducin family protein [Burkholderia multivorans]|uniref:class II aldolase/adducin family protein n=1 Tax=Burkholderia multivorans TaxID=87883 RepID=UPI000CFF7B3E|nr:class II aldolase/adducin family protein [Burkholderia multivorans]MBU9212250.1 class II aldolase/adducin family protein [Burkholderia multivorans]MCL4628942.1 class II aldolase/adducin family protein [Burkholderia multivorans]PRG96085.1 class II aldolase [Burkholderia multivorans]HEF4780132.1 class II aldolase [Burkholderia multivorans]HEF4827428.1 class II aldolase [Burkholderia multivorans]